MGSDEAQLGRAMGSDLCTTRGGGLWAVMKHSCVLLGRAMGSDEAHLCASREGYGQ